jgi:hypothetical protein
MAAFTTITFYLEKFLMGRNPSIPEGEFGFWAMQATEELKEATFNRIDPNCEIPEEVQRCCCEVAEKLYSFERMKGENGLILKSYGNDGETGSFHVEDIDGVAQRDQVFDIIRKHLGRTGLLYRGAFG